MLVESFVAIMALVAASCIDPAVYFAMNSPAALIGTTPEAAAQAISQWGFVVTPDVLRQTAADVGESTILSRAGGRHGANFIGCYRRQSHDGFLVPLRYSV